MRREIAKKIKCLREVKNLKQDHVAKKIGVSAGTYSNIENGKAIFTIERVRQLCDVLQVDYIQFLSCKLEDVPGLVKKEKG